MRGRFRPELSGQAERDYRALMVARASILLALLISAATLGRILVEPLPPGPLGVLLGSIAALALVPVWLRLHPHARRVAVVPTAVLLAAPGAVAYAQGGIELPILAALPLAPIAGTFLGGRALGLVAAAGAAAEVALFLYLGRVGHLFPGQPPGPDALPLARGNVLLAVIAISTGLAWLYETRRVDHLAALRTERERYSLALEASHEGLIDWELGGAVHCSEQLERMMEGAPRPGSTPPEWIVPADRDRFEADLARLVEQRVDLAGEYRLTTLSGPRWVQLRALSAPARSRRSRTRVIVAVRDIEARKRADELKEELLSTVSHELRTPLTSLIGALKLLDGGLVQGLPSEATELISLGQRNADRLLELVNQLLDLQRLRHSGHVVSSSPVAVDDLILDLRREAEELRLGDRVEVVTAPVPGAAACDRSRFRQVWTNLLANAAKFAPPATPITVGMAAEGARVRIWVEDQGPGVPSEMRERIFEPFSQVDSSDTRGHGGSGLGLSIVAAIVRGCGGEVHMVPRLGGGSRFVVDLPRVE